MNKFNTCALVSLAAAMACVNHAAARAELITNGGFETGLNAWNRVDQQGSDGSFNTQSGTSSPVNGFTVSAPIEGSRAAMTDSTGPGSHVLYQDFVVPTNVGSMSLRFALFVNNAATTFSTPATLDFATPALNQQARVDIMSAGADAFSTSAADVFQNVFQTTVGSPPLSGYTTFNIDVSALLAAHSGQTLRLRFAEVDNVNSFNLGVDAVSLNTVPAPSAALIGVPMMLLSARRKRRSM